jgi:hypothetical protein
MARSLVALLFLFTWVPIARAQTGSPCRPGSGLLTPASIGGGIRDGQGVGTANLGSTPADIERVWGDPESCAPQQQGTSYTYFFTGDAGQTGWLVVVMFVDGRASDILVTAYPHGKGLGPRIQTARGIGIFDTEDELRRRYGSPPQTAARSAVYGAEGVAFMLSRGRVGGILVFRPGTTPSGLRP